MDYKSIYDRFIESRLNNPPSENEYFERHHIVPRCMGGSDDSDNMVSLIPEDHLFAHLCLAKTHNTKGLWAAVFCMLVFMKKPKQVLSKNNIFSKEVLKNYGWVVRKYQETNSGSGASRYSDVKYPFKHIDGRAEVLPQWDFAEKHGLTKSGVCLLVNGKMKSLHGWHIAGKKGEFMGRGKRKGNDHPMVVKKIYNFRHIDGRTFSGTPFDFCSRCKINRSNVWHLVNKKRKITHGWFLDGQEVTYHGRVTGLSGYLKGDNLNIKFKGIKRSFSLASGEVVSGTLTEVSSKTGISRSTLGNLVYRKSKSTSGVEYLGKSV